MTRHPNPARRGWSLLELLIVLSVMVGIAGIAFPRLTRPLAESEVQRAAADFRDHLVDCRQTAVLSGRPLVLRLERGTGAYLWGEWAAVLAEDAGLNLLDDSLTDDPLADDDSATTSGGMVAGSTPGQSSAAAANLRVRRLSLPAGMVFEAIHEAAETPDSAWSGDGAAGASDAGVSGSGQSLTADDRGSPRLGSDSVIDRGRGDPLATGGDPESTPIESGRRDYLAFLPSGQSRDRVVVFRESASGMRVALELDAITGMTRLVRLPAVAPDVDVAGTGGS